MHLKTMRSFPGLGHFELDRNRLVEFGGSFAEILVIFGVFLLGEPTGKR
jgi:hypothetical protein